MLTEKPLGVLGSKWNSRLGLRDQSAKSIATRLMKGGNCGIPSTEGTSLLKKKKDPSKREKFGKKGQVQNLKGGEPA